MKIARSSEIGLARMQQTSFVGLQGCSKFLACKTGRSTLAISALRSRPRINASGSLTSADTAVRLLTLKMKERPSELAKQLDELNQERQRIVEQTVEEAHRAA